VDDQAALLSVMRAIMRDDGDEVRGRIGERPALAWTPTARHLTSGGQT
jgi:hypothetical protein